MCLAGPGGCERDQAASMVKDAEIEDLKKRLKDATDIIKSRDDTISARDAQIAGLQNELENERRARVAAEVHISGLQERLNKALHEVDFWARCTPHISGIPQSKSHVKCAKHLTKLEGSHIDGDAKLSDGTRQPLHCTPPSPRLQYARRKGSALPTNWLDGQHGSQIGKYPVLGLIPGPAQQVAQVTADGELFEPPHPPTNCIAVRDVEAEAVPPKRITDGPPKRPMGSIQSAQHYNSFRSNQCLVLP